MAPSAATNLMNTLQALFINIMFIVGVLTIGIYVLLWIFSLKMRKEIESPKFKMLEGDRKLWKDKP
jgi:heme/copper-type cytochrome/quinol oxidase subunit 2